METPSTKVILNFTTIINCDVAVTLTFITLGESSNSRRVFFERFATIIYVFIFREDGVLDLLNWEEEEVLDILDFESKFLVL